MVKKFKKGISSFHLVGEVKINDFSFDIDKLNKDETWKYNRANIGVNCGDGNIVYADMMGGFFTKRPTKLYVNSKDDFSNVYEIDFEDRHNDMILEKIHNNNFIKIGVEKDVQGKTFVKKFLSEYDAILYLKEHLENGMVVSIRGNLSYNIWKGNVQVNKNIKSIYLSSAKEEDFKATFAQEILTTEDSIEELDKETNTFTINAWVKDYVKELDGVKIERVVPIYKPFELEKNEKNPKITKFLMDVLKAKEGVNEIGVEGKIIEGQQKVQISEDDLPEDIKQLIEIGILDKDEVLGKMAVSGGRVRRFVITKPYIKIRQTEEGNRIPELIIRKNKYDLADLTVHKTESIAEEDKEDEEDDDLDADLSDGWLKELL